MESAQLINTYKDKWVGEYGNAVSQPLEDMWLDIFNTLEEATQLNSKNRKLNTLTKGKTTIINSPMGAGKSTTLKHYLANMDDSMKALIVVELKDTVDKFEEELQHRGAVGIHTDNKRSLDDNLDAPILIITHSKLVSLITKSNADKLFKNYDLVAIDESINTYQSIEFSYHELITKILPTFTYYKVDAGVRLFTKFFKKNMEQLRESKGTVNFTTLHRKYDDETDEFLDYGTIADELEDSIKADGKSVWVEDALNLVKKLRVLSKQGRMKVSFFQQERRTITFNIVIDFFPIHVTKVILDGTANINETYQLINDHGVAEIDIKEYPNVRTYRNATVHYLRGAIGRTSLTTNDTKSVGIVKKEILDLITDVKNHFGEDEKVLFLVHKDNAEFFKGMLPTNYAVLWWGKHIGTNDFANYKKMVVYGLNYLPDKVYQTIYYSTFTARTNVTDYYIDSLKTSLLSVDILQGITRCALRQNINQYGDCPEDVEIFITLPKTKIGEGILEILKGFLQGAKFKEWGFNLNNSLTTKSTTKVGELVKFLNKKSSSIIPTAEAYNKVGGIFTVQEYRGMFQGAQMQPTILFLQRAGWEVRQPTQKEKIDNKLSGNTRGVFIKLSEFEDETIIYNKVSSNNIVEDGKDINGNEF